MTLARIGGLAALLCAATYLFGFALLVTVLAPLGFGSNAVDPRAVADFIATGGGLLIAWNTVIYVVNALALAVLVVALAERLAPATAGWAAVTRAYGLIWAALVLAAGMIANVAIERTGVLYAADPQAAAELWSVLHAVELGLGGGNEIAGGVWILCVSLAGLTGQTIARPVAALGVLTGGAGFATIWPALGDAAGAIFGLGAIAWFIAVGALLLMSGGARTPAVRPRE